MDSKIPVPTDNVFKFYALFSLLVLVFSMGAVLYVNKTTNATVMAALVEIETLKQEKAPSPPQQIKKAVLERQFEIAKSEKRIFLVVLAVLISGSGWGMYYGFKKWHTELQPVIDETAKVQLEIAKLQLEKLRRELSNNT